MNLGWMQQLDVFSPNEDRVISMAPPFAHINPNLLYLICGTSASASGYVD